jgi:hypothetical protein
VPLEWFRQKQAINTSIQGPVLRQKVKEMTLKLNIHFTPSNGWFDQFRKCAGLSYRTTSRESKRVPEEDVGTWTMGVHPSLLSKYDQKDTFNADE